MCHVVVTGMVKYGRVAVGYVVWLITWSQSLTNSLTYSIFPLSPLSLLGAIMVVRWHRWYRGLGVVCMSNSPLIHSLSHPCHSFYLPSLSLSPTLLGALIAAAARPSQSPSNSLQTAAAAEVVVPVLLPVPVRRSMNAAAEASTSSWDSDPWKPMTHRQIHTT